jgi:selenide,water dikinase
MTNVSAIPIEKNVLLVGAGNAHLQFVKRFGMKPIPGVAVTLVSDFALIPYSAMVPGYIAGDFRWDEITVDLVRLCRWANVRLVSDCVVGLDSTARQVSFNSRPPFTYDVLSLGIGSLPACPPGLTNGDFSLPMRPLTTLVRRLEGWERMVRTQATGFHLVVVGAGASGCELALAIHKRLGHFDQFRETLLQGNDRLMPQFPASAQVVFQQALQERGISLRLSARVIGGCDGTVELEGGEKLACNAVLWATHAAGHPLMQASGLAVNDGGFLKVKDTLQSVSDPSVFGTGDCVSFESYPDLPKNGVHAVRQGGVLFENVQSFLLDRPLRSFQPQRFCLALLNTADRDAVLSYGPITWKGRAARRLKNRIDRAWIDKFTRIGTMRADAEPNNESPMMRCGGCGSKISSDVLSAVLKRIQGSDDPRIILGRSAGEDAAVFRMQPQLYGSDPERLVEVQTVDYFKAFIDDAYLLGRIAALHSVSDLYAMNARPFTALAIATLPLARGPVQEQQLYELLSGAVRSLDEAGAVLAGGHTTEGNELAIGFSLTGFAEEGKLFQKSKLQPGDLLLLTKPLGSGALLAAWMRGECEAEWLEQLTKMMLLSNGPAAEIFSRAGVAACTDITGFGLAGHLFEMLDASRLSARLFGDRVPLFAGFPDVVARGIVSTLQGDNAKLGCRVQGPTSLPEWLFDPQTSGGLLGAVRPEVAEQTIARLVEAGAIHGKVIGEVMADTDSGSPILLLD